MIIIPLSYDLIKYTELDVVPNVPSINEYGMTFLKFMYIDFIYSFISAILVSILSSMRLLH